MTVPTPVSGEILAGQLNTHPRSWGEPVQRIAHISLHLFCLHGVRYV